MKPNDEQRTNMKDQNYAAMSEHTHVDGIYPFPAVMQTRMIETNGTSIHVRVGGHGPAVVMLHGFGTTGVIWRAHSSKTTWLSRPTCVGWASRRSLMAATTRRIRRRTWWASWTPWVCVRPDW